MGDDQPAVVRLDGRAAVADLEQLPRSARAMQFRDVGPVPDVRRRRQVEVLAIAAGQHHVLPVNPTREQRHPLVLRGGAAERRDAERREVVGLDQLRHDLETVERRIGRVVRHLAVVVGEPDEAGVLHAVGLVRARGEDHPLGERGVGRERGDVARRGEHADDLDRLVGDGVRRALALERAQSLIEVAEREPLRERIDDRPGDVVARVELDELRAKRCLVVAGRRRSIARDQARSERIEGHRRAAVDDAGPKLDRTRCVPRRRRAGS